LNSKKIDEVYVSTDNIEIETVSRAYGANIIRRPKYLATDEASTDDVLIHAAQHIYWEFDYMVLLQPTSPLRFAHQIDAAIQKIIDRKGDSLLSVCRNHRFIWSIDKKLINFKKRVRRQELPLQFMENGSIYITSSDNLKKTGNRLDGQIEFYIMPYFQSFEIDEYPDITIIEGVLKYYDFN